jgi:hypothetical protein
LSDQPSAFSSSWLRLAGLALIVAVQQIIFDRRVGQLFVSLWLRTGGLTGLWSHRLAGRRLGGLNGLFLFFGFEFYAHARQILRILLLQKVQQLLSHFTAEVPGCRGIDMM